MGIATFYKPLEFFFPIHLQPSALYFSSQLPRSMFIRVLAHTLQEQRWKAWATRQNARANRLGHRFWPLGQRVSGAVSTVGGAFGQRKSRRGRL